MFRLLVTFALLVLAVGCTDNTSHGARWVVLTVPFEHNLVGQRLVAGEGKPSAEGPFPDATGIAQALYKCGQNEFSIVGGYSHWEAVTFRSYNTDLALIRCVAKRMPADFTADYTNDHAVTAESKLEPIRGI